MSSVANHYMVCTRDVYNNYKELAERAMLQVPDEALHWKSGEDANSIATIVKHLSGNMQSRWTDFLDSDGEKEWRQRDQEFEDEALSREMLMALWETGWNTVFMAMAQIGPADLERSITISQKPLTVMQALQRNLTHTAYHVGQIVALAKTLCEAEWQTLSIPRNKQES